MTKSIDDLNHINGIGCHTVWLSIVCRPNQTTTQWLYHLESMSEGLQVCSVDVGTLWGTSGQIVEMLKQGSADNCCVQEVWFESKVSQNDWWERSTAKVILDRKWKGIRSSRNFLAQDNL